jgi:hypothetical protein
MFVIVELQTVLTKNMQVYLWSVSAPKFYMPGKNGALVIAIKPKAKKALRAPPCLLYCILQNYYLRKGCLLFPDLLAQTTLGP